MTGPVRSHHWGILALGTIAIGAVLERRALKDGKPMNTATGRLRRWMEDPVARVVFMVAAGGLPAAAIDHFAHNDGKYDFDPRQTR